ncbi:helix-turn-helix transcriptional regulator [Catenulispora yoronensis]|uniref:helix-turn-helix transcriptional regulator n=1 Tax=Catenulispora yoronensis TaxID=450799 RepID=UPI0031D5DCA2
MTAGGPTHQQLIARDRLLNLLDAATAGKVTVISAPAGSGKTSLLRNWVDLAEGGGPGRQPGRVAYIPGEQFRGESQPFWLSVLDAVRYPVSRAGREPAPTTPHFEAARVVDLILAELAAYAAPDRRIVLAIDDVHELISAETAAHLTRLLSELPDGAHAVLATRRDLPLRLHRLRLVGELTELRARDLRFTGDEARALLAASGTDLPEQALAQLMERTEGWAAGLRLAAVALAGHPDPRRFVAEFSGSSRAVAQYLVAEMLERQPADVQELLLRTSILRRVNGALADRLTGRSGTERILLGLEDANAFVVSLDPERTWFRYHRLFGDLLRLELRRRLPGEMPALHRGAAEWLERGGQPVEAVRHRQLAGDWDEAAALLADQAFSMILDGQEKTMQSLLHAFPDPDGADHPELSVAQAAVDLAHGGLDDAAAHLTRLEDFLRQADPERRRRLAPATTAVRLSLARRRGQLADVLRHAEVLDAPVGPAGEPSSSHADLRVLALMNLGIVEAWALGPSDGARHLSEGAELARGIGRPYLEVACRAQLGYATKFTSLTRARQLCEQAIALAEEHSWGTATILAPALITLAESLVWSADFDAAEEVLERARRCLRGDDGPGIRTLLHLVEGMLLAGRGRPAEALARFTAADEMQSRLPERHALTGFVTGQMLAARCRPGSAESVTSVTSAAPAELAELAREQIATLPAPLPDCPELRNAVAVSCLALRDAAGALAALAPVTDAGEAVAAIQAGTTVESWLLAALAHRDLGQDTDVRHSLERALDLAVDDRIILPFLTCGVGELLAAVPDPEPGHASLIADILAAAEGSQTTDSPQPPSMPELSPTELRVLRYLPTHLSRPEIADQLSVSVNTVSTHFRNIYAKLQATDRSSAVQRARDLRLLGVGRLRRSDDEADPELR